MPKVAAKPIDNGDYGGWTLVTMMAGQRWLVAGRLQDTLTGIQPKLRAAEDYHAEGAQTNTKM